MYGKATGQRHSSVEHPVQQLITVLQAVAGADSAQKELHRVLQQRRTALLATGQSARSLGSCAEIETDI